MRKIRTSTTKAYMEAKRRERERYYVSTQLYPPRKWTPEDEDELMKLSREYSRLELSPILKRSTKSIEHKLNRLSGREV